MIHNGHIRINLKRLEDDPVALFQWCFNFYYRVTASEPTPREIQFYMNLSRHTSS